MQVPTVGLKPKRKVEEGECSARLQDKRGRIPARCLARAPSRLPCVLPRGQFFRSLDWKRRSSWACPRPSSGYSLACQSCPALLRACRSASGPIDSAAEGSSRRQRWSRRWPPVSSRWPKATGLFFSTASVSGLRAAHLLGSEGGRGGKE